METDGRVERPTPLGVAHQPPLNADKRGDSEAASLANRLDPSDADYEPGLPLI